MKYHFFKLIGKVESIPAPLLYLFSSGALFELFALLNAPLLSNFIISALCGFMATIILQEVLDSLGEWGNKKASEQAPPSPSKRRPTVPLIPKRMYVPTEEKQTALTCPYTAKLLHRKQEIEQEVKYTYTFLTPSTELQHQFEDVYLTRISNTIQAFRVLPNEEKEKEFPILLDMFDSIHGEVQSHLRGFHKENIREYEYNKRLLRASDTKEYHSLTVKGAPPCLKSF